MPSPFLLVLDVPALSDADATVLLGVARAAVRAAATGTPHPRLPIDLPPRLCASAGAFVSLHRGNELRGCVGSVAPAADSLAALVGRMAAAASRDPRFPPLTAAELEDLCLEVSVLSRARRIAVEQLDPRRHGILLRLDSARAVLLPQVAQRYGWDRETLLEHLCVKAGLPAAAWLDPATVLRAFTVATIEGPYRE